MKRTLFTIFLAFLLVGCATKYHTGQYFATGYVNEPGPGKLQKVIFSANEYTSKEKVQMFTLFRCAQLGKKMNKPYFSFYQSLTDAALNKKSTQPAFKSIFKQYEGYGYVLYKTNPETGDLAVEDIYERYEAAVLGSEGEGQ